MSHYYELRIEFVTAAVWKKSYVLSRDNHASLHKARLMFPAAELHLAKHADRAEALLIAHYGRRTFAKPFDATA